ncbi:MAG: lysophospholipid acyltransferase family protein [Rhodospirillaceae bacterium]|jgi:KDO2-lipid IV(A) lauroyltransferase|nr:lysophospholipid acyltransferase family protein [Rhodospirillaceae bacterium]
MACRDLAKPIRYRVEAILAYSLFGLFRLLPVDVVSAIGGALAGWFGPLSRAHRTAQQNLARTLPDLSDKARRIILAQVWNNFGRVMTEYATLSRLARASACDRIEVIGLEHLEAATQGGRPTIMYSAHLGSWEITALAVSTHVEASALVYRAPNNPLIESLLHRIRGETQATLIPKGAGGARTITRTLKNGGFVQMAVDQKMNTGLSIPFMGRPAMTGDAIARLALRHGCALLPVHSKRLERCRFRVTIEPPWMPEDTGDQQADIHTALERVNQSMGEWIKKNPGQWLWLHNRWPKDENLA